MPSMILEKVKSEGLAHLSYLVGHKGQAAVIDPRRDGDVYLQLARKHGLAITHIFETHRNEDYVVGSQDLARHTGASIYHGSALDFAYGNPVSEGDTFELGDLRLKVLETPGHTIESISLVAYDTAFSEEMPVAVFTGDALFIGDVGRTDLLGDAEKAAELLHQSIFGKILPLGDQVIVYPAHGAGSVCGSGMAAREFSTIGYEKRTSPPLQHSGLEDFVALKMAEHHYQPPYFKRMEEYNKSGAPPLDRLPHLPPLGPAQVQSLANAGAMVVDTRSPEAFAGSHIPGSLFIPSDMLASYAGYLLDYDTMLILVTEAAGGVDSSVRELIRMGYDQIGGCITGLNAWQSAGLEFGRLEVSTADDLRDRRNRGEDFVLLDVRKADEYEARHVEGAQHIFLGHLYDRLGELAGDQPIMTMCSSGARATIAASILAREGSRRVSTNLGSLDACEIRGCGKMVGQAA
jgi:hydroxyacylglutathione hydrolase